jgi:hypothetical protein
LAVWALLAPIAAIWASFYFGWVTTGVVLIAIYAAVCAVYVLVGTVRSIIRLGRRLAGVPHPHLKSFHAWDKMYVAWRTLRGPVINPIMVRQAMTEARDAGAVWDGPCRCLIDRVIQIDPAV